MIAFTIFNDVKAKTKKELPFSQSQLLPGEQADKKTDLPLLKLATFGNHMTKHHSFRSDANVVSITGAEIDYDGETHSIEYAAEKMRKAGIYSILYTSPSYTAKKPRWRILLPFDSQFVGNTDNMRAYRAEAVRKAEVALGFSIGPESLTLSQAFFFGEVKGVEYRMLESQGQCIDKLYNLSKSDYSGEIRQPTAYQFTGSGYMAPGQIDDVKSALKHFDPNDRFTWIKVGMILKSTDAPEAFKIWDDWSSMASGGLYKQNDQIRRWEGFEPHDVTINTLFHKASDNGWVNPMSKSAPGNLNINPQAKRKLQTTNHCNVERKNIDWLWPGRIACGSLTIIAGRGGSGKSTMMMQLASIVTNGDIWPCSSDKARVGRVLWITGEESLEYVMKARADVAGVCGPHMDYATGVSRETNNNKKEEFEDMLKMSVDSDLIAEFKEDNPDLRLVVIDPLSAFLDAENTHKESDVRAILSPWVKMAEETGLAIVFIAHFNKGQGHASDKLSGSTAIRNTARALFYVYPDNEDEELKLFLPEKNNLAPVHQPGLMFKFNSVLCDPTDPQSETPQVEWIGETKKTVHELHSIINTATTTNNSKIDEATDFLRQEMEEGQGVVSPTNIRATATEAGISFATVKRAKEFLGYESTKDGFNAGWHWVDESFHLVKTLLEDTKGSM